MDFNEFSMNSEWFFNGFSLFREDIGLTSSWELSFESLFRVDVQGAGSESEGWGQEAGAERRG